MTGHGISVWQYDQLFATPCFKSYFLYIKYYPQKKQLEIGFKTGNVYRYFKVHLRRERILSKTTSEGLSGEFFNAHIRERYKFERIA